MDFEIPTMHKPILQWSEEVVSTLVEAFAWSTHHWSRLADSIRYAETGWIAQVLSLEILWHHPQLWLCSSMGTAPRGPRLDHSVTGWPRMALGTTWKHLHSGWSHRALSQRSDHFPWWILEEVDQTWHCSLRLPNGKFYGSAPHMHHELGRLLLDDGWITEVPTSAYTAPVSCFWLHVV